MEKKFKISVFGQYGVGKTSFIHRFVEGQFLENKYNICGIIYKKVKLNNDKEVNVEIWNCYGSEAKFYLNPTKIYFKNTDGIILVYDITKK